jgi:hypothetical protein
VLIHLDACGNTAQLYEDWTIAADDYYSSSKMTFSFCRHQDKLAKGMFLFHATPLMPERQVYFEGGSDLEFDKNQYAELKGITAIPEYSVKIQMSRH